MKANVKIVGTLNTSGEVETSNELTANATVESGEVETEATVETSKTLTSSISVTIPTTLKANVKLSQEANAITKSDHAGLKNLDYESSGHTGFASKSELQEYAKKTDLVNYASNSELESLEERVLAIEESGTDEEGNVVDLSAYLTKEDASNTYIAKNGLTADLVQVGEDDHISGDFFATDQRLDIVLQNLDDSLEAIAADINNKQDKCINNNVLYFGDTSLIGIDGDTVEVGSLDDNLVLRTIADRPQWTNDGEALKDLAIVDDINDLQNQIDSASKLELKSQIQRIGEYRYLIIQIPYSDSLLNEINSGKVNLQLYKQSKKKATQMRNAFVKWTCPTGNIGFGSEHFKKSFGEGMFTVDSGGISIPPFITIGENTSSILEMTYTTNIIQLTYNLSELAKAMCFLMNDDSTVTSAEWDGSMGENKYTDTVVNCSNVIGKRFRHNRVALRYKMRLYFETTRKYSEYTDTITILYTKHLDTNYVKIGMQIN